MLGIHAEKTIIEKEPVFIAALFAIARTWGLDVHQQIDEWIQKL